MQQCTASVQYLHRQSPPIVHRDIKLENFLLTDQGTIKLCDFGSVTSRVITPDTMQFKEISMASEEMQRNTTPMNRTPEMLQMSDAHGKVVGLPGDIWALGTSLYMLCFRNHPFPVRGFRLGLEQLHLLWPIVLYLWVAMPISTPVTKC